MLECSPAMRTLTTTLLLASSVAVFCASTAVAQDHSHQHGGAAAPPVASQQKAVLLEDLGGYAFPVSTQSEEAQKFFNQGMILVYGFNHDEAVRSFRRAAELDPKLAMAHWGIALALGPNYNVDVDAVREKQAHEE